MEHSTKPTETKHVYLYDLDEPVRPNIGPYYGEPGRVVYRREGKIGVVFEWDVAGLPVEYKGEELDRR